MHSFIIGRDSVHPSSCNVKLIFRWAFEQGLLSVMKQWLTLNQACPHKTFVIQSSQSPRWDRCCCTGKLLTEGSSRGCCVHGASCGGVLKPTTNMAAAVRMRTWSCPTRGVFHPWAVLFLVLLSTITLNAVVAAPETGLWKITVVNVSISLQTLHVQGNCSTG